MTTFIEKLRQAQLRNQSWLCVGLDPVMERLPEVALVSDDPFLTFGRAIVEATADLACAYKPNLGFWLAEGSVGLRALQDLISYIPNHLPVILDAKFNDVGHTAAAYARAAFETLGVDAVTANPYLGLDSLRPFLQQADRGIFLLARTSNPSATDLQDLLVHRQEKACAKNHHPGPPSRGEGASPDPPVQGGVLYEEVTRLAVRWNAEHPGSCGLVVGATYPEELARLREMAPHLPFLIPGVGAQGGNLEAATTYGPTAGGEHSRTTSAIGPVINSSRSILYASSGPDFAKAARSAALALRDQINQFRETTR
ncbi:MAG: orotidine-5'-phosphate decarboxylase [Chloroflexota bacterium]|nr:orotidine-5'-phosphate decarboxylase [Chloroflexota bacterium]